jgi:hypothetical protein
MAEREDDLVATPRAERGVARHSQETGGKPVPPAYIRPWVPLLACPVPRFEGFPIVILESYF